MGGAAKRRDGRETVTSAIAFACEELSEVGPVAFNLDRVISTSGISRGSIYHHFGNRAGLIAAAEAKLMLRSYDDANKLTRHVVEDVNDGQELIAALHAALMMGAGEDSRRSRERRIASLAASDHIPLLRETLMEAQRKGMKYYVETLQIAVDRGLIEPVMPLDGIANVIQSFLIGRVLVDLLDDEAQDANWVEAVTVAMEGLLRPNVRGST